MHGKKAGYLFGSITNLAVEAFMGWRLGLVMYAIFLAAFNSQGEAIFSQIIATIAVGGFGFYVAQFRTISLDARINEIKNLQQEEEAAKKKMIAGVKRTMRIMVGAIIAVDAVGAVYIGVTSAQADGLVGHAIAGSALLALLSIIPFCAGGFIQAVAKLMPQEEREKLMQRVFYGNLETMDNAVGRYNKKARKLDPEIVLSEGWAGLEAAAAALDKQEGHQGMFVDSVAQMRALQRPIQAREQRLREEDGNGVKVQEERPMPRMVKGRDYDASAEIVAIGPAQLEAPEVPDESESATAGPFGNTPPSTAASIPNKTVMQLVTSSGVEPGLLLHLLESGQLENLLVRFIPGSRPSGRQPTRAPVPDVPFMRLSRLLHQDLLSREQLVTLVQQHDQLASVLSSLVEQRPQYSVSGARIPTDAETE